MIEGIIDISHHQTSVDLASFKAGGGFGVILKATQGSGFIDDYFTRRVIDARMQGLLVGAYHFCDGTSPMRQADLFVRVAGMIPAVRLFLDIEENSIPGGTVTVLQAAEIAARIETATGKIPDTYTGAYQPDGTGRQWGRTGNSVLKRGRLWISHYTSRSIPDPLPTGWKDWTLWQWTETGTVQGVSGPVDRNRFNGDEAALRAWWPMMKPTEQS